MKKITLKVKRPKQRIPVAPPKSVHKNKKKLRDEANCFFCLDKGCQICLEV